MNNILAGINEIMDTELNEKDLKETVQNAFEWNSFNIMCLMIGIQERFGVKISLEQISNIQLIEDIINIIQQG